MSNLKEVVFDIFFVQKDPTDIAKGKDFNPYRVDVMWDRHAGDKKLLKHKICICGVHCLTVTSPPLCTGRFLTTHWLL